MQFRPLRNQNSLILRPRVLLFEESLSKANWGFVWLSLVLQGVTSAVAVALYHAAYPSKYLMPSMLDSASYSLIGLPFVFMFFMCLVFIVARLFGGRGSLLGQCYAFVLFQAPLWMTAVVVLASLVPALGPVAAIMTAVVGLYGLWLAVIAVATSHDLPISRVLIMLALAGIPSVGGLVQLLQRGLPK